MSPDTGPAGLVSPHLKHQDHKRSHDGKILFSPSLLVKVVSGAEQLLPRVVVICAICAPPIAHRGSNQSGRFDLHPSPDQRDG